MHQICLSRFVPNLCHLPSIVSQIISMSSFLVQFLFILQFLLHTTPTWPLSELGTMLREKVHLMLELAQDPVPQSEGKLFQSGLFLPWAPMLRTLCFTVERVLILLLPLLFSLKKKKKITRAARFQCLSLKIVFVYSVYCNMHLA